MKKLIYNLNGYMKTIRLLAIFILSVLLFGCTVLNPVSVIKNSSPENFKYVYISPTSSLTSSSGSLYGGAYGIYGGTTSKSVNPADVISGILAKKGFIRLHELKSELSDETIIVNYGESGKRSTGFGGYTIEVTIQFISAKSNELISSCTAEGQGTTEADDIRQAITRCLTTLFLTQSESSDVDNNLTGSTINIVNPTNKEHPDYIWFKNVRYSVGDEVNYIYSNKIAVIDKFIRVENSQFLYDVVIKYKNNNKIKQTSLEYIFKN